MGTSPTGSNLPIYVPYSKPHMPDCFQKPCYSSNGFLHSTPLHPMNCNPIGKFLYGELLTYEYDAPQISIFCLNCGTGYRWVVFVSLRTTMQLSVSAVTTASVPLTQPESMSMFLRNTTLAPFNH